MPRRQQPMKGLLPKLRRALTHPRAVVDRLALERDYTTFRQAYAFLAQAARYEEPTKRLLIVSLSNWVAQVKTEVMLASALRLHGWTPYVLSSSDCTEAQRYFRACGINHFIFWDKQLRDLDGGKTWSRAARQLLSEAGSFKSLLDVRHRGVDVGRHVLSTIVRRLRCGRVDLTDSHTVELLQELIPQSLQAIAVAERVLDDISPGLILFLEKGYSPYGEVFDVALNRDINTIQWVHSHRSDALALKRYTSANRHEHPFSLSPETWRAVQQMPWTDDHERALMQELKGRYQDGTWFSRKFLQSSKHIKSAEEVRQQLGLDPQKKTATVFSHVLWDATFFFGENLFDDYEEWLVETVKVACANPAVNWIVKLHPDYVWKLKAMGGGEVRDRIALDAKVGALPPHVKLLQPDTDISAFSLFDVSDYCVTVRGTIGIEMACWGIPVFTAGTGRYAGFGFTVDSSTREEYLNRLRRIQETPRLSAEQILRAKQHAYALLKLRPLVFTTFELVQSSFKHIGRPLDHNMVIRARSFDDVRHAPDLKAFASWATESAALDYLQEKPIGLDMVGSRSTRGHEPAIV